ncbi:MAG: hypothetical protein IPL32_15810 [Chloracidobacterium sp.]|nr:hypothetical protein [Chloracidobacterium sp.]
MGLTKKQYIELHSHFFELRGEQGRDLCEILDYDEYEDITTGQFAGPYMRVVSDAQAGVNELLNWINHFARTISDIEAWTQVLNEIRDKDERFSTLFEVVSPVAFMTMSFPAAIRGKLVFTSARAIRDLFNLKKSKGKVIFDHELSEKRLSQLALEVPEPSIKDPLGRFISKLEQIDGDEFRQVTMNYRNRANHQIAPNIEYGERLVFAPLSGKGFEGFSFGVEHAIRLCDLIEPLKQQHSECCLVYKAFWDVVIAINRWTRMN